jgi:hypothetical protein
MVLICSLNTDHSTHLDSVNIIQSTHSLIEFFTVSERLLLQIASLE